MAGPISLVSADFLEIKQQLQEYIESTGLFPGADFTGSNWSVVLDTLAYQAQLNAYNANLISNESILEAAVVRKNVVSGAKQIGYVPVSARGAKTLIDFQIQLKETDYPAGYPTTVTLQPGMAFSTSGGKQNFIFNTTSHQTSSVRNDGLVFFNDVEIIEGVFLTEEFTYDYSDYNRKYVLRNQNVDTTTVRVEVQENPSEEVRTYYTQADNLVMLTEESRRYFIEETENGYYEIVFGDGLFGYKPADKSKVNVTYLVSSGPLANGVQYIENFKFVGKLIDSYGITLVDPVTTTSVGTTNGGADVESISSIKYRAPREFAAQNRCVTSEDYDVLIRRIFPPVDDLYVYGGETLQIAQYGRVYIAIKPKTGTKLSNITKNYIKKSLEPYRVASLDINIVDPDLLYAELTSIVYYDEMKTIKDKSSIKATVIDALNRYVEANGIARFGGALRYSQLVGVIDESDQCITRNNTTLTMRKDLQIVPNTFASYELDFKQEIDVQRDETVVYSTGFKLELDGIVDEREFFFENDPTTIRYETLDDEKSERQVSDLYCFYINEFFEKVRVSFYFNKFNELIVVDVLGEDQVATPFGVMSFGYIDDDGFNRGGKIELAYKFKNGINIASTTEADNIIQVRAKPKNFDIFAEESVFLNLDVSRSNIQTSVDNQIAGS